MSFSPDDSVRLPASRDDEPPELRQDIADELADHLQCSMSSDRLRDESSRGRSDAELFAEAVTRFGDPAAVARRLWWDAMREKIMTQRIVSFTTVLAALACVLCAFFMYRLAVANQDYQQAMLASQQKLTAVMLAEFRSARDSGAAASDWQPLRVRLVDSQDRSDGHGVQGGVTCQRLGQDSTINQTLTTDANGLCDFSTLPSGQYHVIAHVSDMNAHCTETILLGPGRPNEFTIECPPVTTLPLDVRFEITPPDPTKAAGLYYVAILWGDGQQFAGRYWRSNETTYLLLDSSGKILGALSPQDWAGKPISFHQPSMPAVIEANYSLRPIPELHQPVKHLRFAACIPEVAADPSNDRPKLHTVTDVAVNQPIDAHEQRIVIRIGADNAEFWNAVTTPMATYVADPYSSAPPNYQPPPAQAPENGGAR